MRYLALSLFLCAISSLSLQAQKYYDLDLSRITVEDQSLPSHVNYESYYQASTKDFMVANLGNNDIIDTDVFFFGAVMDNNATKQVYTAIEVCYDVFNYKSSFAKNPSFKIPGQKSSDSPTSKLPADSRVFQLRVSQPLQGQRNRYQVIYDLLPKPTSNEGYQCVKLDFPQPYTLPLGSKIYARTLIGTKEVIRIDRIRLYRSGGLNK